MSQAAAGRPPTPFHIGFTGARKGLTPEQVTAMRQEINRLRERHSGRPFFGRHGDTIGGDVSFHSLCQELGIPVIIHPALDQSERAHCPDAVRMLEPAEFAAQSDAIIGSVNVLIAAPDGFKERLRGSGTWMTIRRARKHGRDLIIVFPDGTLG